MKKTPITAHTVECHPLIRRLSGQVIWCMFEEYEADPDDIQTFLDTYEETKAHTLALIARIQDPVPDSDLAAIRIDVEDTGSTCEFCKSLHGKYFRTTHANAASLVPPFGLGCAAKATPISPEELAALAPEDELSEDIAPPCNLICGDWIFTHKWSK